MEDELKDLIAEDGWNRLYADIRRESANHDHTTTEAARPQNRALNRYRDVYPYDHSRVVLDDQADTDYINASLVLAPRAGRSYILAQGPLPGTVGHFWLAAWQQRSRAVLMLNRVMEKGQLKCHQYWPVDVGDDMVFADVGLRLDNVDSVPGDHYTVRTLRLTHEESGESRDILHFHYTTWPDFGVPACPDTFLQFLAAVRESGSLGEDVGPPIVHCSAGIGRSGTFCLVDTCLVLIAKEGPESVSVREVLLELRNYRMGLIQTPDQLKFSYLAIAEGAIQEGRLSRDVLAGLPTPRQPREVSTDDSDDDAAPPPLPPPRSESLKMQQLLQSILDQNNLQLAAATGTLDLQETMQGGGGVQVNGNGEQLSSGSGSDPSPDSDGSNWKTNPAVAAVSGQHNLKTESPTKCILNNHKMEERKREMELRRRKKEEATAATAARVAEMKRRSREADEWHRSWMGRASQQAWPLVAAGLAAAVAVAGTYYYTRY